MSCSSWNQVTGFAGLASVTLLGFTPVAGAQVAAQPQDPSTPQPPDRVAQLLYPSPDESASIKVMGRGEATMPADRAQLTFSFTTFDPSDYAGEMTEGVDGSNKPGVFDPSVEVAQGEMPEEMSEEMPEEMPAAFPVPQPLTRATLKPVVDALKQAGVTERDISVEISAETSTGEVRVRLEKPRPDRLQALSNAVETALADADQLYLSDTQTRFEIRDCQPLEVKAYGSAIANARLRAEALSKALGTSLSGTPRVAESPFDLFSPASCNEPSPFIELMNLGGFFGGAEPPKAEVTIKRDIFVTFPVR
ncbi:MAG: SIMPL domain-containing protein [Synechococcales cyanobacterium CRU_2_2]|nr:SIMPL domain-containing protein [Synechococcales cyanobacterium CRU_2_2]